MMVGAAAVRIFLIFLWTNTVPKWSLILLTKYEIRFGGNFDLTEN